jgi:hypothetical protein
MALPIAPSPITEISLMTLSEFVWQLMRLAHTAWYHTGVQRLEVAFGSPAAIEGKARRIRLTLVSKRNGGDRGSLTGPIVLARWGRDRRAGNGMLIERSPSAEMNHAIGSYTVKPAACSTSPQI